MASRRDKHHARRSSLAALGKNLSRRARSRCELCEATGRLTVVEIPGAPEEPEEAWALLACDRCRPIIEGETRFRPEEVETLRFLTTSMWSELQGAQIVAVRALRGLDTSWSREALDGLWLDEAVEALI